MCMIASIALLVASFIVPPMGEISPSVLKGGSLIFAFAALMEVHGDTTVEVKDLDGKEQPAETVESVENAESDE